MRYIKICLTTPYRYIIFKVVVNSNIIKPFESVKLFEALVNL